MKKFMLLMIMLFAGVGLSAQNDFHKTAVQVLPSSQLTITGDTNINTFKCVFDTSFLEEQQDIHFRRGTEIVSFKGAVLTLETDGFDCGSKAINRDFRDLIKADRYPQIFLELKKIKIQNEKNALATVLITIAGKQKSYDVSVSLEKGEISRFKGQLHLNINDYELEPPKKLFGMIVVKDEIDINFDLKLKIKR